MTNSPLKDRLKVAQTQLLLTNIKTNVFAALVVATVMLLVLMQQAYEPVLIPWYLALVILMLVRLVHSQQCERTELTAENVSSVIRTLGMLSFLTGCLWGVLCLVFLSEDNLPTIMVILVLYTGLVANASLTMSSVLRIYLLFVIPILVPTVYKFYSLEGPQYAWIAVLVVVYMSVSFITTGRIRASLRRSNMVHLENDDLIEDLRVQNRKTEIALEHAEQANRAKSRFFAAASHDLRQPLQSISMYTTTLATHTETTTQKKIVSQIDKSVRSLEGLFNALLDISSLDAGTIKLRKQHFHLKPYIDELSLEFEEWCGEKDLELNVSVADDVIYSDPLLLSRIIRNLVENAVRYTSFGSVSITSKRKRDYLLISITDTGLGIPHENKGRIFEEFVQLNNPGRDRNKGLGLGLSIVQRICILLDMQLSVESNVGQGSVFSVGIEYGKESEVEHTKSGYLDTPDSLDGMFVLIIDDEEEVRESMEGLLGVWGCTVMVASSGAESAQQIEEYGSCPNAIITDYRLQNNETGADALALIREHCQVDIPAIVITGDISPDRLLEIDKLNLPVLHKPCSATQLLTCLQKIHLESGDADKV